MEFDVEGNLGAVERRVSMLEREGKPAGAVTLSRSYDTTLEDLWDAVTNLERIPKWFAKVTGEFELGGGFSVERNASGTITDCERQSHFELTWEFAGDVSWVKVALYQDGQGAPSLTLTHTSILSAHWDTYGPGAAGVGWEWASLGLAFHIARPSDPRPDEVEFVTSRDGKAFMTGSSQAWGQAAIEAGAEPMAAQEAARQTTAFYTGESA